MMKTLILSLLLSFTITFVQAQGRIKEADELFANKNYREALAIYKQELAKSPADIELMLKTAKANVEMINYADALELYERAIKADGKCHKAYFEKGKLLNSIGMLNDAKQAFEQAIKLQGEGEYFFWRGVVCQQQKDDGHAFSDYETALKKGVSLPELYTNYAILLVENNRLEEALKNINRAIAMNGKYPEALSARARIHFLMLDVDSACIDRNAAYAMGYKNAFEIPSFICNGTYAIKMQYAGEVLMQGGYFPSAIEAFTRAMENKADSASIYHNRGYCFYRMKEYGLAESDYLKALTLPNAAADLLYDNLSLLYFDQNMFGKTIEYANKRIALNPANPTPYIDRGLALRKQKKYKEAEADFNKALEMSPNFFRAYGYRAFLYLETGNTKQALEDAQRAVTIEPSYAYGYLILGQAKQKLGQPGFCTDFQKAAQLGWSEAEAAVKKYCK